MDIDRGPDVAQQLPAGGNPSTPPSGEWGANAAAERLDQSLSGAGTSVPSPGPAQQPKPMPMNGPRGRPPQTASPSGVPDVLLGPTTQPEQGISAQGPRQSPTAAVNAAQRRLQVLSTLANPPEGVNVSEATQEWAAMTLQKLAARQ